MTSVAHCTDSAGRSTCTPGVVKVITCLVMPELVQDVLPVVDVAVALDDDVVVAGVVDPRVTLGVLVHGDRALALLQLVEVFGRVVVVVDVENHRARRLSRVVIG